MFHPVTTEAAENEAACRSFCYIFGRRHHEDMLLFILCDLGTNAILEPIKIREQQPFSYISFFCVLNIFLTNSKRTIYHKETVTYSGAPYYGIPY
jgi:hypothetical protein